MGLDGSCFSGKEVVFELTGLDVKQAIGLEPRGAAAVIEDEQRAHRHCDGALMRLRAGSVASSVTAGDLVMPWITS